jgi:protein LSM14
VRAANASLESVERALDDLRVSAQDGASAPAHHGRSGRRGGKQHEAKTGDLRVPTTDFDFQSSNARFDKAALAPAKPANGNEASPSGEGEGDGADGEAKDDKATTPSAYNPKASFFDSLSSGSNAPTSEGGRGGRGYRRGGGGRNRREEEREKNVATFGEPGGIGLMGPGAYVGGWGGYGRRGGGRGGRRGGGGSNNRQ